MTVLREPGSVNAARGPTPLGVQDHIRFQPAPIQKNDRPGLNQAFREQYEDQIENKGSGEPGQTQQSVLLIQISGLTSMWESQSDYYVQIAKVQSGSF